MSTDKGMDDCRKEVPCIYGYLWQFINVRTWTENHVWWISRHSSSSFWCLQRLFAAFCNQANALLPVIKVLLHCLCQASTQKDCNGRGILHLSIMHATDDIIHAVIDFYPTSINDCIVQWVQLCWWFLNKESLLEQKWITIYCNFYFEQILNHCFIMTRMVECH